MQKPGATMKKTLTLLLTHSLAIGLGIGLGIYALPILIAPKAPTALEIAGHTASSKFTGNFRRNLKDSDAFHWGDGILSVSSEAVVLTGELAPGPDYKLYLSPEFVETEADFHRLKDRLVRIGDVKTFNNFIVPVPESVDPSQYNTVIIWCEAFGQFITAARYN
jgi:hypothetical protein